MQGVCPTKSEGQTSGFSTKKKKSKKKKRKGKIDPLFGVYYTLKGRAIPFKRKILFKEILHSINSFQQGFIHFEVLFQSTIHRKKKKKKKLKRKQFQNTYRNICIRIPIESMCVLELKYLRT